MCYMCIWAEELVNTFKFFLKMSYFLYLFYLLFYWMYGAQYSLLKIHNVCMFIIIVRFYLCLLIFFSLSIIMTSILLTAIQLYPYLQLK
jgi:hypothetical protein